MAFPLWFLARAHHLALRRKAAYRQIRTAGPDHENSAEAGIQPEGLKQGKPRRSEKFQSTVEVFVYVFVQPCFGSVAAAQFHEFPSAAARFRSKMQRNRLSVVRN